MTTLARVLTLLCMSLFFVFAVLTLWTEWKRQRAGKPIQIKQLAKAGLGLALGLMWGFWIGSLQKKPAVPAPEIQLTYLMNTAEHWPGRLSHINIQGDWLTVTFAGPPISLPEEGTSFPAAGEKRMVYLPNGTVEADLVATLRDHNVTVSYAPEPEKSDFWGSVLSFGVNVLWIAVLFIVLRPPLRNLLPSTKKNVAPAEVPKTRLDDVAGIDEVKQEVGEIVTFLKNPEKFTRLGGRIPKGVLLTGSPGTGKTLLARAIAGEAGVPFFSMSGSEFVEVYVGLGAGRVRKLFQNAKKNAPCLLFIDEIDAVGGKRSSDASFRHEEREQTLNQLLVEMDGFEASSGVIVVAATNRPDMLDKALLRPGRFDRQVIVPLPDVKGREEILRIHTRQMPVFGQQVVIEQVARTTPGLSGAELEAICNEAAILAARDGDEMVFLKHFEQARDKAQMGLERKHMVLTLEDKRRTAYHEAGHALVAHHSDSTDPPHKITIIPRGVSLGATHFLPTQDRHNLTKKEAEAQIAVAMGGRAAEMLVFQQLTTGAGNDLIRATEIARNMICRWGMSERLGPTILVDEEGELLLHSEVTLQQMDEEVRGTLTRQENHATRILNNHRPALDRLAKALLDKETLEGSALRQYLEDPKEEEVT